MFKLATMFVELKARDAGANAAIDGVKTKATSAASSIRSAFAVAGGNLLGGAISSLVSGLKGAFGATVGAAMDMSESLSKAKEVFGASSSVIIGQADRMAASFGASRKAMVDAGAAMGLVFQGAGVASDQSATLGAEMSALAADCMSFYNVPLDVALEKIQAGLVGEAEPLRQFGVLLTEDAVRAKAVEMGLARTAKSADETARVLARTALIREGLSKAKGDLERTLAGPSNQWRKLTGLIANTAAEIGASFLPAVSSVLGAVNDVGDSIAKNIVGAVKDMMATGGVVLRNFGDEWLIVSIKAREMFLNIGPMFNSFIENASIVAKYIAGNWRELIVDGFNAVVTVARNLAENIGGLASALWGFLTDPTAGFNFEWKPLLDGFKATAAALPELARPHLVSLQDEIDAVGQRIADREGDLAQKTFDEEHGKKPAKAAPAAARKKAAKDDFKAETKGLAEFAMELRAKAFEKQDDTAKQQLGQQVQIAKNTKKIADHAGRPALAVLG